MPRRSAIALGVLGVLCATGAADAQPRFNVIHTFTGLTAPKNPSSVLVNGGDGNLYGLTCSGGRSFYGTAIRLSLAGAITVLHEFDTSEGYCPAGLVIAGDATMYGVMRAGPGSSAQRLFRMTRQGVVTPVQTVFPAGTTLQSLVAASDGNLYARASASVYRVAPAGTVTLVRTFAQPVLALTQASDGNLYGVIGSSTPSIFRLGLDGTSATLHTFTSAEAPPVSLATLVQGVDGNLYGGSDGSKQGIGSAF